MGDSRDTRSTTGMVFTMYGVAVTWQSRLQPTIARSTCEAEYMAAAAGCQEAQWLRKILRDIGHAPDSPTVLHGDNKAALALLDNVDMMSSRVRHIDNRHHACKEQVTLGNVSYKFCASATNIADCLTKAIPRAAQEFQREAMGLKPLHITMDNRSALGSSKLGAPALYWSFCWTSTMLVTPFLLYGGLPFLFCQFFLNCDAPAPLVASPVVLFVTHLGCILLQDFSSAFYECVEVLCIIAHQEKFSLVILEACFLFYGLLCVFTSFVQTYFCVWLAFRQFWVFR